MNTRKPWGLACCLAVVTLAAGCGNRGSGDWSWLPLPSTAETAESTASIPESYPEPKERDPASVMAALRQIDACKLIDPAAGAKAGFPASAEKGGRGPHQCGFMDFKTDGDIINVVVGDFFDHSARYQAAPTDVGNGMRAYQRDKRLGSADERSCAVSLPVSFTLAVSVEARQGHDTKGRSDSCAQARAFAPAVAAKLATPDAVRLDPAEAPLAQWDACAMLAGALGADHAKDSFQPGALYGYDGIDSCTSRPPGGIKQFVLYLSYSSSGGMELAPTVVDHGVEMRKFDYQSGCQMEWKSKDPLPGARSSKSGVFIWAEGPTCAEAGAVLVSALKRLATPPTATPQRPLLFTTGEPDDPAPGPCADFLNGGGWTGCTPAQNRPVPKQAAQLLQAGEQDPNVACAAAMSAVHKHLGADARPIVFDDGKSHWCIFVEYTHTVMLSVQFKAGDTARSFGHGDNRVTVTVDGHPGVSFENSDDRRPSKSFELAVASGRDAGTLGMVYVGLMFLAERGEPIGAAPQEDDRKSLLIPLATDLMHAHFR